MWKGRTTAASAQHPPRALGELPRRGCSRQGPAREAGGPTERAQPLQRGSHSDRTGWGSQEGGSEVSDTLCPQRPRPERQLASQPREQRESSEHAPLKRWWRRSRSCPQPSRALPSTSRPFSSLHPSQPGRQGVSPDHSPCTSVRAGRAERGLGTVPKPPARGAGQIGSLAAGRARPG